MEKIQNTQTDILRVCGSLAIDMNLLPLAFDLLSKVLHRDPLDVKTLLLLSNAYMKSDGYINVIHLLINAINSRSQSILNDPRIWKQLAISYYKLNRYDDSNHAISQALSSFDSGDCNNSNNNINHNSNSHINNNHIPNNNNILTSPLGHNNSITSLNNDRTTDDNYFQNQISQLAKLNKQKLFVLRCRISLLADPKAHRIESILPFFDEAVNSLEMVNNLPLYVEILITRAQLFRKYGLYDRCKDDLFTVIGILNENANAFKVRDLIHKVSYAYHFLASIQYTLTNNYKLSISLINESLTNFNHTESSAHRLTILACQINYLNATNIAETIDKLTLEVPMASESSQAMMYYMIARLSLRMDPIKNIEVAYEYYQKALSIAPEKPYVWISIAALYLRLGQLNDALSTYSQAINLSLSNDLGLSLTLAEIKFYNVFAALAWFGISQVYTATNQLSSAIDAINQAIRLFKLENATQHVRELELVHSSLILNHGKWKKLNEYKNKKSNLGDVSDRRESHKNNEKSKTSNHDSNLTSVESSVPSESSVSSVSNMEGSSSSNNESTTVETDQFDHQKNKAANGKTDTGSYFENIMDYSIPNVPMETLIDFETYKDYEVFKLENVIDRVDLNTTNVDADTVRALPLKTYPDVQVPINRRTSNDYEKLALKNSHNFNIQKPSHSSTNVYRYHNANGMFNRHISSNHDRAMYSNVHSNSNPYQIDEKKAVYTDQQSVNQPMGIPITSVFVQSQLQHNGHQNGNIPAGNVREQIPVNLPPQQFVPLNGSMSMGMPPHVSSSIIPRHPSVQRLEGLPIPVGVPMQDQRNPPGPSQLYYDGKNL